MAQAEADPTGEDATQADDKGIFVSASLNTFGGIVDAHNGLAKRLMKAEKQLEAAVAEHAKSVAESAAENLQRHEELRISQNQALEEAQKENRELHESLKTLLEERATALEKQQDKALRTLDESLRPTIKAMERSVEDLVRAQAEWTGVTLPRWRADIGTDIQRLSSDLAEHISQWEERANKQEAKLDSVKPAFEESLASKVATLEGGIAATKEQCATLGTELRRWTEGELQGAQAAFSEQLDTQGKRLGDQLRLEAKEMVDREKVRIGDLEHVIKEYDFERLKSQNRLGVDLNSLRDELPPLKEWAQEQITKQMEKGLAAKAAEMDTTLSMLHELVNTETKLLSTRLGAAESDSISLRVAIDNADKQCKATDSAVRAQLEEQGKLLEGQFNAEVDLVRSLLHLEGARLAKLEGSLSESNQELQNSSEKLAKELGNLREQLQEATKQNTEQQINLRLKPVQQNLTDLQEMLQEVNRAYSDRDNRVEELGEALREVQDKVFSGYSGKYRNRPGPSTGLPGANRPSFGANRPSFGGMASKPWDDGTSTPAMSEKQVDDTGSAYRPSASRPSSANFRRVFQPATGNASVNDPAATDLKGGAVPAAPTWTTTASRQPQTARPVTSRGAAPGSARNSVAFGQTLSSNPAANLNRIPLQHCILR